MNHIIGNWYKCDNEFYILAQVGPRMFCLVGLAGNRWNDPVYCKPICDWPITISDEDFEEVALNEYNDFQLVKMSPGGGPPGQGNDR